MATINLGRIKPVWKNTWTATTAYVVDDIVRSGRASYICINAHTSAATFAIGSDWQLMSDGGVDGTDGTDGTTVGTGTAGQVLKTNSAGNGVEWGAGSFGSHGFYSIQLSNALGGSQNDGAGTLTWSNHASVSKLVGLGAWGGGDSSNFANWTCGKVGYYYIQANVLTNASNGVVSGSIERNGSQIAMYAHNHLGGYWMKESGNLIWYLAVGDVISLTKGAAGRVHPNNYGAFSAWMVGE